LAPTTSTTCTMALGDALAVTILKNMNLTAEQFKVFHPGGKLGQKLMKITDLMDQYTDLAIVTPDTTMDQALLVMTEKNLGCLLIMNDPTSGQLSGIITDGDLKRHMNKDLLTRKASEIMTTSPKTITETALAAEAVDAMTSGFKQPITSLIVTDEHNIVKGIIRMQSCLQAGVV
jgi:arabinose-5-phosphate isomerase